MFEKKETRVAKREAALLAGRCILLLAGGGRMRRNQPSPTGIPLNQTNPAQTNLQQVAAGATAAAAAGAAGDSAERRGPELSRQHGEREGDGGR